MKKFYSLSFAALAALLLTGCSATVLQSNKNVVQVDHFSNPGGLKSAMQEAAKICSSYGRIAVLDKQTCPGMNCVTQFRCED